jgi:hypothetical protein
MGHQIAFNPDLGSHEKEQLLGLVETFHKNGTIPWFKYDIALKALLYSIIFYIVASDMVSLILVRYLPRFIDKLIIQSILYGLLFYVITVCI